MGFKTCPFPIYLLAAATLETNGPNRTLPRGPRSAMSYNVALFITCLTDQFFPHVGIAVTKILEHFGCKVYFPEAQTCCGQPFYNNGFHPEAAELAQRMIEIFEPYDYVVKPM